MGDPLLAALIGRAQRYFPSGDDGEDHPVGTAGMFAPPAPEDVRGAAAALSDWWDWRNAKGWDLSPDQIIGFSGPLKPGGLTAARGVLEQVARGERPRPVDIGYLTPAQFDAMNAARAARGMPTLSSSDVRYNGRHHYASRAKDGDSIDEMLTQIDRSMDAGSDVVSQNRGPALVNPTPRVNPRGETVLDQAVLEGGNEAPTSLFSAYGRVKRFPAPQGMFGSTPASGSPEPAARTMPASGLTTPESGAILPLLSPAASADSGAGDGPGDTVRALLLKALREQPRKP